MKLTPEQLKMLSESFIKIGAFDGYTEEKVEKILNNIINYYVSMAEINFRIKAKDAIEDKNYGDRYRGDTYKS